LISGRWSFAALDKKKRKGKVNRAKSKNKPFTDTSCRRGKGKARGGVSRGLEGKEGEGGGVKRFQQSKSAGTTKKQPGKINARTVFGQHKGGSRVQTSERGP